MPGFFRKAGQRLGPYMEGPDSTPAYGIQGLGVGFPGRAGESRVCILPRKGDLSPYLYSRSAKGLLAGCLWLGSRLHRALRPQLLPWPPLPTRRRRDLPSALGWGGMTSEASSQ